MLDELRDEREQIASAIGALENLPGSRETKKVLAYLEKNRLLVEDAVLALANLARSRGKTRGRRPTWIAEIKEARDSR